MERIAPFLMDSMNFVNCQAEDRLVGLLHIRYFQKYLCKFIIKAAAVKLNTQKADIAINWMGGLHHAKESGLIL
jgi:hypothetical protein